MSIDDEKFLFYEKLDDPKGFLQKVLLVFDENDGTCNLIYKYRNNEAKWAFKWIKKKPEGTSEYMSEFEFDDVLSVKDKCLLLMKDGKECCWYYHLGLPGNNNHIEERF